MGENRIRFNEFFTKTLKILLYIQQFILKWGSNSNCHKIIPFHSFHVTPKQDYLHSIHFHSFPFLYFKISNQGYLISFHSIPFFSILFPYLNTFHYISFLSIPLWSFHSIPLWTPKQSLNLIPFPPIPPNFGRNENLRF